MYAERYAYFGPNSETEIVEYGISRNNRWRTKFH